MFHECSHYKEHWLDIQTIIESNYHDYYDDKDLIITGGQFRENINDIKSQYPGHKKTILYQLEPLVKDHWWPADLIYQNLKMADEVWDYDFDNIRFLKSYYNIDAKFRPMLYTEKLKRVKNKKNLDIDILFYGSLNDRRMNTLLPTLQYLHNSAKIVILNNILGQELDHYISRSKIILDLKAHDYDRQKQTRIIHALMNDKCVVTEKCSRNYFGDCVVEAEDGTLKDVLWECLVTESWKNFSEVSSRYKKVSDNLKSLVV